MTPLAPVGEPNWISVEDRFPPRHQNVLCHNRNGSLFEGRICMGMHKPFFTYPRGDGSPSNTAPDWIDVTHWMPLPQPPGSKSEGAPVGGYRVSVQRMDTSGGGQFFVCLDRPDRPLDAAPWDAGRITPFVSTVREYAEGEAARWRELLGAKGASPDLREALE